MRSPVCLTARRRRTVARHYPLPSFLPFFRSFFFLPLFLCLFSSLVHLQLDTLSLFLCLSLSFSPRRLVYASGSDPSGVRDLARGYAALRGGWPRKENVLAASRYLSSLPLISDTTGYLLRLRARALSALRLSTMGSAPPPSPRPAVQGGHRSQRFRVSLVPRRSDGSVGTKRKLYRSVIAPRILVRIKVRKIDSRVYYPNEWEGGKCNGV